MRIRHVMNKVGSSVEQSDQGLTTSGAASSDNNADPPPTAMASEQKDDLAPSRTQAATQMPEEEPIPGPKEEELDVPDSPWAGDQTASKLGHSVEDCYSALLHSPDKWHSLNKRLNQKGGRDVLFRMEDVIKDRGLAPVREEFLRVKPRVNADLIWMLHQPLLSLMFFILKEQNDIHRKLIRVPELKSDICRALGLGRPSKKRPPPPKLKLERQLKPLDKPKGPSTGEGVVKKKKAPTNKGNDSLRNLLYPPSSSGAAHEEAKEAPRNTEEAQAGSPGGSPPAKKPKTGDSSQDSKSLHQLIAASQDRDRSGKFVPGFSPVAALKLKKLAKKPPGLGKKDASKGLGKAPGKGGENAPAKKTVVVGSPKGSSRKQLTPRRAQPADGANGDGAAAAADRRPPGEAGAASREDTEIAELVIALRTRGEREARALESLAVPELDERIGELEAARGRADAELVQLRARRRALLGEGTTGEARERAVGEPVRAAREVCLRTIRDLLDALPATFATPPLSLFNELERTGDFDATLGVLAHSQRTNLQREWNRKNDLAAEAKRAEMEALYQKNKVRRHLGIPPASSAAEQPAEYDAIFGAFQQKLAELRQDMERQVKLLDDTENAAKQAWLAYREAA